ncbi:MAG: hypothetical protein WB392_08470 [Methanotrichaceae archaeon]
MKHNDLSRRLEALESEMPSLEELHRLGVIIERIGGDRDKLTPEEIAFLEGLES